MARLIRMDKTGHTTLAEWTTDDPASVEAAVRAFREQLDEGAYAIVTRGEGEAEQVHELVVPFTRAPDPEPPPAPGPRSPPAPGVRLDPWPD